MQPLVVNLQLKMKLSGNGLSITGVDLNIPKYLKT